LRGITVVIYPEAVLKSSKNLTKSPFLTPKTPPAKFIAKSLLQNAIPLDKSGYPY
jgi:hypothetical protein